MVVSSQKLQPVWMGGCNPQPCIQARAETLKNKLGGAATRVDVCVHSREASDKSQPSMGSRVMSAVGRVVLLKTDPKSM